MALAHRIIPTLLCKGRTLVKGQRFEPWRAVGLAVQGVRINARRGVDELALLDVSATLEGRGPDFDLVRELSDILYSPLIVGGGVRTVEDVKQLLRAGADSVVIGSAAWAPTYDLVRDASVIVGRQAITVSVDVRGDYVFSHSGTRPGSVLHPERVCAWMEQRGAGEIFLTSIEREGTMQGYDLELIRKVSAGVTIPVIAHGGCKSYADMADAIHAGAAAVAAGALFQFTEATPRGAAEALAGYGIEVRL